MENKVLLKNLERIEQYNKELANKILMFNCKKSNISIIKTKKDEYNLVYKNILIHSNDGAVDEAREITNKITPNNNSLRIIYGLGLGYLPDEMVNLNNRIIIYEPKLDILKFVLSIAQIDAIYNKNVYICSDKDTLINYTKKFTNDETKMTISFLPSYKNLFYDDIIDVLNCAQRAQGVSKAAQNTYFQNAPSSLKNQFKNLSNIFKNPSIGDLRDIYKGKTALVLSAGPSLRENIETIKQNKDKFIIFAINASLKVLAEFDIQPDFVINIEAFCSKDQFSKTDMKKSYLILESFSNPDIYSIETKRTFNYISKINFLNPWIRKSLDINDEIDTFGTVSYTALSCAYIMGFDKIILCGQDLAYKDGKCYAQGSQFEQLECVFDDVSKKYIIRAKDLEKYSESLITKGKDKEARLQTAKDYINFLNNNIYTIKSQMGTYIPTQTGYALFVDFFREFAKKMLKEKPNLSLINSSTGGAQIDGFENVPLIEALDNLEAIERIDLTKINANIDKDKVKISLETIKAKLNGALGFFDETRFIINKILKELEVKKVLTPNCEKLLKKLKDYIIRLSKFDNDFELKAVYFASYCRIAKLIGGNFLKSKETLIKTLKEVDKILADEINRTSLTYLPELNKI